MITVKKGNKILFVFGKYVLEGEILYCNYDKQECYIVLTDTSSTFMISFSDIIFNW